MDRRKHIFEEWQAADYLDHLKRLKLLMGSNNPQHKVIREQRRSIEKLLARSHEHHKLSNQYKQKQIQKQLQKENLRMTKFTNALLLPKINSQSTANLTSSHFWQHSPKSMNNRRFGYQSPKSRQEYDILKSRMLENSLLHSRITHADSYYQKKDFDKSMIQEEKYKDIMRGKDKNGLMRNTKYPRLKNHKSQTIGPDALEEIYKESSLMRVNYPKYSYVHVTNLCHTNKTSYHRVYIKFCQLPELPQDQQLKYSFQCKSVRRKQQPRFVNADQLAKDLFVFKLPLFKVGKLKQFLKFELLRCKGVESNPIAVLRVYPGQNQNIKLYYGDKPLEGYVCATSWKKIKKTKNGSLEQNISSKVDESLMRTLNSLIGEDVTVGLGDYLKILTLDEQHPDQQTQGLNQGPNADDDVTDGEEDEVDATSLKDRLEEEKKEQIL